MSEAKRLLEQATPLPWEVYDGPRPGIDGQDPRGESVVVYGEEGEMEGVNNAENAALIVYAVNALPDYEAAVEALERLVEWTQGDEDSEGRALAESGRAALARLREGEAEPSVIGMLEGVARHVR